MDILSLVLYTTPLLFFLLLLRRRRRPRELSPLTSFVGVLPQYLRNRHRFLEWITEIFSSGPTLTMLFQSPGQETRLYTADPLVVEHILKSNFANYPKGESSRFMFHDVLGDGIFNADGELWRTQRKTVSLEFSKKSLRNFVVDVVQFEIEERLLPLLEKAAAAEDVIDLQEVLERFAFDNICKVAFGVDPASLAEDGHRHTGEAPEGLMQAFDEVQKSLMARFYEVFTITWRIKRLLDIGSERRLRQSAKTVRDFATSIVRKKLAASVPAEHDDLLSRFISAGNADQTVEFLRDVVINFMIAGRDTTSTSLTWFFWLLSSRPDVRAKILREVESVRAARTTAPQEGSRCFSFDELREMHYLHAAITESMRLYPPAPLDMVSCAGDEVLPDGTFVGNGWFVTYSAYSMGRMEKLWGKDCEEYRPERWLEEGVFRPESPYKFPVFHAGPRMCLGKEMAYIQMKSIAASMVERFDVEVAAAAAAAPGYILSFTLKMKGGLPVRIKNRG